MDKHLSEMIDIVTPNFNQDIVEGMAYREMRRVESHIDKVMRTAAAGFPEGIRYVDYRRCTPDEEVREIFDNASKSKRASKSRTTLELSHSSIYLVKYMFTYRAPGSTIDEALPDQHLYLPYVKPGGLITLRGSTYTISPTLADNALSVQTNTIFIQMSCGKLTFERRTHNYFRLGDGPYDPPQGMSVYVVSSQIHNRQDKKGDTPTVKVGVAHTLVNYLFCKYGVTPTFQIFANADVVIGNSTTITRDEYPSDQWYICTSTRMKPPGMKTNRYESSDMRLAVRKDQWSPLVHNLIGGFFYMVDFFPSQITPEFADDPRMWKVILGYAIFGEGGSHGRIIEDVQEHLNSLDRYLNGEIQKELIADGIVVEDIYGFFVNIIETMHQRIAERSVNLSSMYDKKLMVMRFALADINHAIFNLMFKLQKSAKKNLNKLEISKLMRSQLKPDTIIKLNKDHNEVSSVSAPGDNMFFKTTSLLVPQSSASGKRKGKGKGKGKTKSNIADPTKFLHASIAEVGSYTTLPKSDPIGHSRISPFVHMGDDGSIVRNPDLIKILDATQNLIQR